MVYFRRYSMQVGKPDVYKTYRDNQLIPIVEYNYTEWIINRKEHNI